MTAHDEAHGDEDHGSGEIHVSLKGYLTGFGLSVVLTAIPFWMVMTGALASKLATAIIVMIFAATQMVVHMIYFMHMDARIEKGWSLLALIFTLILIAIAMSGTLWVMYHLQVNMMPSMQEMRNMP
jgi:cytochrome o ubiquinol oxidase subunit IV